MYPNNWYRIELPYAVGAIRTNSAGYVKGTAPIFNWMQNKHLNFVTNWVAKKGGTIQELD